MCTMDSLYLFFLSLFARCQLEDFVESQQNVTCKLWVCHRESREGGSDFADQRFVYVQNGIGPFQEQMICYPFLESFTTFLALGADELDTLPEVEGMGIWQREFFSYTWEGIGYNHFHVTKRDKFSKAISLPHGVCFFFFP